MTGFRFSISKHRQSAVSAFPKGTPVSFVFMLFLIGASCSVQREQEKREFNIPQHYLEQPANIPVFWNTSWFKMRPPHVTGMLIHSKSQAFANFPTDYHSDLQWWEIANRSQVMILEDFPAGFKPLVQPIDTWFLNRRLALIFETKVGNGKLLVSSADLRPDLENKPAAKQLFSSLQTYMLSAKFNPQDQVSFEVVNDVFVNPSKESFDTFTKDSPDELKPAPVLKK